MSLLPGEFIACGVGSWATVGGRHERDVVRREREGRDRDLDT